MQFPLVLRVPVPPARDLVCRRLGFGEMDASHTVALAGQPRKLRFFVQRFVECDVLSLLLMSPGTLMFDRVLSRFGIVSPACMAATTAAWLLYDICRSASGTSFRVGILSCRWGRDSLVAGCILVFEPGTGRRHLFCGRGLLAFAPGSPPIR